MERYLKQFQTPASFAYTFIAFFVVWFFGLFYCNPYNGTDEYKISEYYSDISTYCRFYDGIHVGIGYGFTWSQLFLYSAQVIGISCLFEATINIFRDIKFEIEPTEISVIKIVLIRLIQVPLIMFCLARLGT